MSGEKRKILIVEPYYGGSHRQFLRGVQQIVDAEFLLLTLPARKWKMRMQLAAPWVVAELRKLPEEERFFHCLLASTFVDLATLRALLIQLDGWNPACRLLLYFHENQFAYPVQFADPGIFQFTGINFNSALAANSLAFNSEYNRRTFFDGFGRLLKKAADMSFPGLIEAVKSKSQVLFPGLDLQLIPAPEQTDVKRAVIVWNHRWEADKNPRQFFQVLTELQRQGIDFGLILLGQRFSRLPECFDRVEERFADNLLHCGFVEEYQEYVQLLGQGTVVVSTASHEFYGLAVIEAVRAGCIPLLPERLSYPELFPKMFLYKEGELLEKLRAHCRRPERLSADLARGLTAGFEWGTLRAAYRKWLLEEELATTC